MREYGKTKSANWINPRLSGCARIMAAYLFGGPHCNWIGCFNCPPEYAAADTDLPLSRVKKAYAELVTEGLIKRFGKLVFLVNFFAIEKVDNRNVATSRFREFLRLPHGEYKAWLALEMLKHFGNYLDAKDKAQLVGFTADLPVAEPLPQPLAEPLPQPVATRDRDRDIYKSKAQQQLIGARASAAPATSPVNDSLDIKNSAPPQPTPEAEPATDPQPPANLPTASNASSLPQPHPADRSLPESPTPPARPETRRAEEALPAEQAADIDFAVGEIWRQLTNPQRLVVAEHVSAMEPEYWAITEWWQFPDHARQRLIAALYAPQQSHDQTGPAAHPAEPVAGPDSPLPPSEAPSAPDNGADKGIIHDGPNPAKNEQEQAVSESPAPRAPKPVTNAAHLRAMGVPESIDLAVWQNFEQMAQGKVRSWSNVVRLTLVRQLRQAIADGADGNALLEWVTVRSLLDLPDAWRRMQADAEKSVKQCQGNAEAVPADEAPVAETVIETVTKPADETVNETAAETVTETVDQTPSPPLAAEKPNQNLTQTYQEPKQALEKPGKGKKKKEKREAKQPDDVSDETWADFLEHRKNRRSLVSERVVEMFRKQAQKANISLDEAMQIAVARGWVGFEAEWLESAKSQRMQHVGNVVANVIPRADGRLPGESVSDAALRVYLEDLKEQGISQDGPLKIGLFNTPTTPTTPALPLINGDTSK